MDLFFPIFVCIVFLIMFSICGWCCKRKRPATFGNNVSGVVITGQTVEHNPPPAVVPPYPVDARHPTPYSGVPAPGFHAAMPIPGQTNPPYPPTGYFPAPYGAPYPPAQGYPPAPYPPAPAPGASYGGGYPPAPSQVANPPPYDEAVKQAPLSPAAPTTEAYSKQSPYNPNY